jgi:hypothetical protein
MVKARVDSENVFDIHSHSDHALKYRNKQSSVTISALGTIPAKE